MKIKYTAVLLLLICHVRISFAFASKDKALPIIIAGKIQGAHFDTLYLYFNQSAVQEFIGSPQITIITDKNGHFKYRQLQPENVIAFVSLFGRRKNQVNVRILDEGCPIEAGDSVFADIINFNSDYSISFSGNNAVKFNCYFNVMRQVGSFIAANEKKGAFDDIEKSKKLDTHKLREFFGAYDSVIKQNIFMQPYKNILHPKIYDMIHAEVSGYLNLQKVTLINYLFSLAANEKNLAWKKIAYAFYQIECSSLVEEGMELECYAGNYLGYLESWYILNMQFINDTGSFRVKFAIPEWYELAKKSFRGKARSFLLTNILLAAGKSDEKYYGAEIIDSLWHDLYVSSPAGELKEFIEQRINHSAKGIDVIDFTLPAPDGHLVKLSDYKGKVVLIDVWFTGCGACISYSWLLEKKLYPKFQTDSNIVFLSICGDINKQTWLKSMQSHVYTRKENVNVYTAGMGFDHPFLKYYNINGGPSTMLIDRNGKIASANPPQGDMNILSSLLLETERY